MSNLNIIIDSMWACWAHGDLYGFPVFEFQKKLESAPYGYNEYGAFEAPRYKENEEELERFNDLGLDDYYE